jgi:hypothetical protein
MKMSVQNAGQRRISMASFTFLFLLAVGISCLAFAKSIQSKEVVSREKLDELQAKVTAYEEKDSILSEVAALSRILQEFDENNADPRLQKKCQDALLQLYGIAEAKDTLRYKNVSDILQMAESYKMSIEQGSENKDDQLKQLEQDIITLNKEKDLVRDEKFSLQNQLLQEKQNSIQLQSQLNAAQKKEGGGSSSSSGSSGGTDPCITAVNTYKMGILKIVSQMQLNLQAIQHELSQIDGILGLGKHKKEKQNIDKEIKALEKNLQALQGG